MLAAALVCAGIAWWSLARRPITDESGRPAAVDEAPRADAFDATAFETPLREFGGEATPLDAGRAPVAPAVAAPPGLQATRLIGRVLRPGGLPVPSAHVIVGNSDYAINQAVPPLLDPDEDVPPADRAVLTRKRFGTSVRGSARSDGTFQIDLDRTAIEALGGGPLHTAAVADHRDSVTGQVGPLQPGETALGDITLPACAGVRLRVVMPDADVPEYTSVRVTPLADPDRQASRLESWLHHRWVRPHGRVVVSGLSPGSAELVVDSPGARLIQLSGLALQAGQEVDLGDLVLDPGEVIEGIVATTDGSPLPEIQVSVSAESTPRTERRAGVQMSARPSQWTRVGPDGAFKAGGLEAGTYWLNVQAPGYAPASLDGVQAGRRDVRLTLQPAAVVLLTLTDAATGEPIEGAQITAVGVPSSDPLLKRLARLEPQILAGAEHELPAGSYRVVGAAEDGTHLRVRARGYASAALEAPPLAPESQWSARLALARGLVVRGRVTDRADRPIEGATVQLAPDDETLTGLEAVSAPADVEGRFELADLAAGAWQCSAQADGFFRTSAVAVDLRADLEDVLVRLTPEARIEGRVLDANGEPVEVCGVVQLVIEPVVPVDRPPYTPRYLIESDIRPRERRVVQAEGGRYVVAGLVSGVHLVGAARLPEEALEEWLESWTTDDDEPPAGLQRVVLALGERRQLDLLELPLATLRGRVLAGGSPASGATVMVGDAIDAGKPWITTTTCDADGRYAVTPLPPGKALVVAVAEGELVPRAEIVTLRASGETVVDFSFSGRSVRGITIDHVSRQPVVGVPLRLTYTPLGEALAGVPTAAVSELLRIRSFRRPFVDSGLAGRFEFRNLPPGRYWTALDDNSWIQKVMPSFVVDDTWSGDDLVVEVSAGSVVEGRFDVARAGFDEATRRYEVGLYHPTENTVFRYVDVADAAYRLQGLNAGTYVLRVRRMDGGSRTVFEQPVELGEGEARRIDIVVSE